MMAARSASRPSERTRWRLLCRKRSLDTVPAPRESLATKPWRLKDVNSASDSPTRGALRAPHQPTVHGFRFALPDLLHQVADGGIEREQPLELIGAARGDQRNERRANCLRLSHFQPHEVCLTQQLAE